MRFNKHLIFFSLVTGLLLYPVIADNPKQVYISNTSQNIDHVVWDGNNISTWHGNHGDIVSSHVSGYLGLEWPKDSGKYAVFQAGLWLAAGKVNGIEEIRTAIAEFDCEFVPGNWGSDPKDSKYRIYEINAKDGQGSTNWAQWPVDQGAPWADVNGDGIYSPFNDRPDIVGDKVHWYVMNDGDTLIHTDLHKTDPLGIEVQEMMFGFDSWDVLGNTVFIKYKIINTGDNKLDSMFISFWFDPDIGNHNDDLVGSVPKLNLGYAYNDADGDFRYGYTPPAVGCLFLQTPIVSSEGDTAWISGDAVEDFKNIPISSFIMYVNHSPYLVDPNSPQEAFNYMNGLIGRTGQPYINPIIGESSHYLYDGDPVTVEGWVDGIEYRPSDRRFLLTSGPFSMAPDDIQEIAMALIISNGANATLAVPSLLSDSRWVRSTWNSQFTKLGSVASIHEVFLPENSETTGPFKFQYIINDNEGWESSLQDRWFHFSVNDIEDSISFSKIMEGSQLYHLAEVPEFSSLLGDTEMRYWISILSSDGKRMTWPSGSPINYASLIVGEDTTGPTVRYIEPSYDINYLLPFKKKILAWFKDNRNDVTDAQLHWQIGDGEVHSEQMNFQGLTKYTFTPDTISEWYGLMRGKAISAKDTIFYWVTAKDTSQNRNESIPQKSWFKSGYSEIIGDWDHGDVFERRIRLEYTWDMWREGGVGTFGPHFTPEEWGQSVCSSTGYLKVGESDTLKYKRSLDLTYVENLWLKIPMTYYLENGNAGFIDVSIDSIIWTTIDTIRGISRQSTRRYDLGPFTGKEPVYLQFRVDHNVDDDTVMWCMDDIILYSDSVSINILSDDLIPKTYNLQQPYPNPFNPTTTIEFSIPRSGVVTLYVYDVLGRKVDTILNEYRNIGHHKLQWNASDMSSGIYFVRMLYRSLSEMNGDFTQVKKVIVVQ